MQKASASNASLHVPQPKPQCEEHIFDLPSRKADRPGFVPVCKMALQSTCRRAILPPERDYSIHYVEEDKPLGTAGSLQLIQNKFEKPFIVTNCDILIHADYEDIYRYHKESGNELTIVTALKNIVVPYGVVHSSENGVVQSMEEKPKLSYFVNTGMYILNPELKKEIPEDTFFHMTDLTDKLLKENRKVGMYPISEDSFLDMGEFEEMRRMEEKLNLKAE